MVSYGVRTVVVSNLNKLWVLAMHYEAKPNRLVAQMLERKKLKTWSDRITFGEECIKKCIMYIRHS